MKIKIGKIKSNRINCFTDFNPIGKEVVDDLDDRFGVCSIGTYEKNSIEIGYIVVVDIPLKQVPLFLIKVTPCSFL